ncbi:MAG: hypothetical protein LBE49_00425, partial [Deltaproteobacteria bacterium]|nr:hypothetical protein [Deltaproteobacteria bacterium]
MFAPEEQIRTAPDGSPLSGAPLPGAETGSDVPYWLAPPEPEDTPYWLQGPTPDPPPDSSWTPPVIPPVVGPDPRPLGPAAPVSAREPEPEPQESLFSPEPEPEPEPEPARPEPPRERALAPALPASPAPLPEPNLGEQREHLSYYMFTDDHGVVHLTDAPA